MATLVDFGAMLNQRPMLGLAVAWPGAGVLERVGGDWDWIWIDGQHGELDYRDIVDLVRAGNLLGKPVVVRVPSHEAGGIGRALDIGIDAIMVPTIDSAEQASRVVQAAKFPPLGNRSYGGRRTYDRLGPGYAHGIQPLLVCQIETPEGLANVDEIAAVPGVDALFFGADDLALRWNLRMDQPRPAGRFDEAWAATAQACRKHGRIAGGVFASPETLAEAAGKGYRLIAAASVGALLMGASAARAQEMRKLV